MEPVKAINIVILFNNRIYQCQEIKLISVGSVY
jgi:hypothetical protein